jgi:UDP:flavonoid glycosyltransferase YjiC (YdhE family)
LNPRRTIAFYISGHGFGHASRAIEVINALIDRQSDLHIFIRSSVAPWLVTRTARASVELLPADVDTGMVQLDSLHLDAGASIANAEAFMATFDTRVAREAAVLRDRGASLAVCDVPPLGIAAARQAGIPAVALGNFTWDWIYEHYGGGAAVARRIGDVYADTTLALRLPMWGGFATMPVVRDLPFVARRSQRDPAEVRAALGLPRDQRIVLPSFGGYGLDGVDASAVTSMPSYHVLMPGSFDETAMYERGYRYEDLVRAVDVVVTKPGYGIVSECIANDTALLYTSRGDFREYQVLVDAMPAWLRSRFITHDDLFAGKWAPHLDALLSQPAPPGHPILNGAEVAADILLGLLS